MPGAVRDVSVRVLRKPKVGYRTFSRIQQRKELPGFVREDLSQWLESFEAWEKEGSLDVAEAPDAEVLERARAE